MSFTIKSCRFVVINIVFAILVFSFSSFGQDAVERLDPDAQKNGQFKKENDKLDGQIEGTVAIEDIFAPEIAQTSSYVFSTGTGGSLTDMTSGTTTLVAANLDDTASALTNIGFEFYFQGVRYTNFGVNENGVLRLGAASQGGSPYQPLAQAGLPIISAWGADQRTHTTGKVHFKVIGSAPTRTLVIEWLNTQSNFNTGGTADLTYQVRLSETTGVIEFVYGSMTLSTAGAADVNSQDPQIGFSSTNTANNVGSVTAAQSGTPAPTFNGASATPVNNLYTAGAITALTSATDGSRRTFTFTPPIPTAPTALTFTAIAPTSYTLNWTDSTDEDLYVINRSTDGVNYSFFATAVENATTFNATGLSPSTNYFWQVYSVSEGALSITALSGSQSTSPAGNDSCAGAGGNWSSTATWADGSVPTAGDNVTIGSGCSVTIDVTTATAINVVVQNGGTLQYITTPASTLTVNGDLTIDTGGTFTAGSGTVVTHVLNIGGNSTASTASGNLTVNGTFDMNTTAGVTTNFWGSADATLSGSGATCDFFILTTNKGTTQTPVLDVTRVITGNAPAIAGSRLGANSGTFKLSSATTWTPWFGSQTLTAAPGRIWINNAGASLTSVGVGTATGAGSPTVNGGLRVDSGTFGYGSGNNTLTIGAAGNMTVNGGTANMFGIVTFTAGSSFNMTGGNFNVDAQAANATAATNNIVRFNTGTVAFTGGTLTIVDPHAATGTGRALSISTSNAALMNFIGGTIKFGDGTSNTAGSVDGFDIDTFVSTGQPTLGNVVVDNPTTNAATRFVRVNTAVAPLQILINNLTITSNGGSRFNLNGNLTGITGSILNDGTLDGTTAASRLYWLGTGTASTYSGAGTSVAPLASWDIDNALGVTINPAVANVVTRRVILFSGSLANSNKLTLGNGDATVNPVQIGNTTTATNPGAFDVPFTFNLGTGGQSLSYLRTTTSRSTGPEINPARTLTVLTYDDNDVGGHTLTVAGGDLTLSSTATALALTNGRVVTGSNTIGLASGTGAVTRTTGLVDGNLRKNYAASANKTFEVGTANGYSPVAVNVTAGTFPGDFTVKATQGQAPYVSGTNALQRYWALSSGITGGVADLTFNYLATDVVGTPANYVFIKNSGGSLSNVPPAAAPTTTQAAVNGVSSFSDWTLAEPGAVLPGSLQLSSATYADNETNADHIVNIPVTRTGGGDGAVSINYTVTDGTAVSPGDYTASASGTLNWASGDTSPKNIAITVKGDTSVEPNETVNIAIATPSGGATLGSPSSAVLTITNDDVPPTSINLSPAGAPTAVDNDYTRINNAVQAIAANGTITLAGTFNWTEPFAAASWALGSDGLANTGDDYSVLVPANKSGVTFTAASLGSATIQGPGDLPNTAFEGVLYFDGSGVNQNWTISNMRFLDFDWTLQMYNGAGPVTQYNNTTIQNNYIRMARDIVAGAGIIQDEIDFQNAGIHYSFGANQIISGNTIDIAGDGVSDPNAGMNGIYAADIGMQSNTSGGAVYNGLQITGNTINVVNAQSSSPEVIIGIWENAHGHSSNITVSGNTFTNAAAGNNPATNIQRAFRITSHSSATTTVTYQDNVAQGANMGFQWLSGSNFAGNQPVVVKRNTVTGGGTGFVVQSQGVANMSFNRIVGNTTGVQNVDGIVTAENNWWGCNTGPGTAGCNPVTGTVDFNPWIVLGVTATPSTISAGGNSTVTALMTTNSDNTPLGNTPPNVVPNMPVAYSATQGSMSPSTGTIGSPTAGQASSTFTSNSGNNGTGCATVDGQLVCANITVLPAPSVQFSAATYVEDESQTATIRITRVGDLSGTSTVNFSAAAGPGTTGGATCTPGVDFITVSNQLVTFAANDPEEAVTVTICGGDTLNESSDSVLLSLTSPSVGTSLGTPSTATLNINDTATQFRQTGSIDMMLGQAANPYPSTITVTGGTTVIGAMRVTLYDVWHFNPDNMDVLLVGPNGQKYVLMADVGGPTSIIQEAPVTLTFSDVSAAALPNGGPLTTGQFLPTSCETPVTNFPAGAPVGPYVEPGCTVARPANRTLFGNFGNTDSNGTWQLFVRDDNGQLRPYKAQSIVGQIQGGWGLEFLASTAAEVSVSGRVRNASGRGITNANVTVTGNSLSEPIRVVTGRSGAYTITGLTAGETYVVTVSSRRFIFSMPSRVVSLDDNVTDLDFTADPSQ